MATALPEDMHQEARPPVATHVAPPSGSVGRPSMRERPLVTISVVAGPAPFGAVANDKRYDVRHRYVRRYWTALLGPTAISDLLRMVQAGKDGRRLRLPHGVPRLLVESLALRTANHRYVVAATVLPLAPEQLARLPLPIRREAQDYCDSSRPNRR